MEWDTDMDTHKKAHYELGGDIKRTTLEEGGILFHRL
jgi:hypothetical protein